MSSFFSPVKKFDLLTLFSLAVALLGFMEVYYHEIFTAESRLLMFAACAVLLVFPERPSALLLVAIVYFIRYLWFAPFNSNHMILVFMLSFFVIAAWCVLAWRERNLNVDPEKFYRIFAPPCRSLLLSMYFFGVFHKLNADFLNPEISCATILVDNLVFLPEDFRFPNFVYYLTSYGTLIIESIIGICLLVPRTRHYAVVAGILFHMLISLSLFRFYVPFTMCAIALHFLFLDDGMLKRLQSGMFSRLIALKSSLTGRMVLAFPVWVFLMIFHAVYAYGEIRNALMVWAVAALVLTVLVFAYDRTSYAAPMKGYLFSSVKILNVVALLFFISCFSPYIGFKSGQTMNMFSNLQTEQGKSNHYIFRVLPPVFDYQSDLVRILDTDDPYLRPFMHPDLAMVGYGFETHLLTNPGAYVRFERGGRVQEIHGLSDAQTKAFEKPWLAKKFMVFHNVNTTEPRSCMDAIDYHLQAPKGQD